MAEEVSTQVSTPAIWIIGDNVLMDGVAGCLVEREVPNLVRWGSLKSDLEAGLSAGKPSLIIFELDTPGSYLLLDFLRDQPGIHLLGIDQDCNQVIVLNSISKKTRTMTDLYQIVTDILDGGE